MWHFPCNKWSNHLDFQLVDVREVWMRSVDQPGGVGWSKLSWTFVIVIVIVILQKKVCNSNSNCLCKKLENSYLVTCWRYLLMISSRAFWCSSRAARSSLFSCCSVRMCLKVNLIVSKMLHQISNFKSSPKSYFVQCKQMLGSSQLISSEGLHTSARHANFIAPWLYLLPSTNSHQSCDAEFNFELRSKHVNNGGHVICITETNDSTDNMQRGNCQSK